MDLMKRFWNDESGQGLTEYAVIIALVSVALILVLIAFRDEIARVFNDIRGELNTAGVTQASTATGT
ncbi:MAG: Flp family type IVb pilin [Longimicrobiales bacterium]|nr:Flp family type IVb pilin [Longimicrobiales bacterium]